MNKQEENLTYEQFINRIIEERGKHGCGNEYHERHHIKPKCLGGTNSEDNMIDLYGREHFIAHQLLAKENPHHRGLQFAWWCMVAMKNKHEQGRYECTAEEYEEAKKAFCEATKGENHPMYGKHLSDEMKQKIKDNHADFKGENHPQYGKPKSPETRRKISEARKGKPGMCGKDNPMYGKHPSEETRRKISEAERGEKNSQHRPVICIETGEQFWGATEAKQKLGIDATSIGMCCRGKRHTAGGYHWRYADEETAKEENSV